VKVSVIDAEIGYRGRTIVTVSSLTLNENEVVALVGPNGAGKTTLLRGLAGVLRPIKGKVEVDGIDLYSKEGEKVRKLIGYMPAEYSPPTTLTVGEFIKFWSEIYGESSQPIDIPLSAQMKIEKLSSGQKKLLSLYRVFLQNPKILILDEPTANLDVNFRLMLYDKINLIKEGRIIIYSTHDISDLPIFAIRIIFIKDGRIIMDNKLEELRKNFVYIKGNIKSFPQGVKIIRAYVGGKFLVKSDGKISEIVKEMVNSGSEIEEVSEVNMYELYRMIMEERV
jgi:ABC-type multidrug transport system, ATPase component